MDFFKVDAERLLLERRRAGLTGVDLARLTVMTQPAYSKIETGAIPCVTRTTIERIVAALVASGRVGLVLEDLGTLATHDEWRPTGREAIGEALRLRRRAEQESKAAMA